MSAEKRALMLLVDGAEESEAIITIDVLRRGGVDLIVAGQSTHPVTCVQKTTVVPDAALGDVKDQKFDMIILPGGPGSNALAECPIVGSVLNAQHDAGRYIAAICGAPKAIQAHKIAPGALVTGYPAVKETMTNAGYKFSDDPVVVSDKLITSQGPGTAFPFALKLLELLQGKEKAKEVAHSIVVNCC